MPKNRKFFITAALLALLTFLIPIEHKYDKLFRFYSLTLIPDGVDVSSQYDKKLYFYISDLIALILLPIGLFWMKIPIRRFFYNFLWVIFVAAFISIAVSPFFNYPIAYSRLLQLLTPIILFSFTSNAYSNDEKAKLTKILLIVIVTTGLFQTGVSIAQYFNQAPLGLRVLGETNKKAIFLIKDGARWLFDHFSNRSAQIRVMRASGTLPHANVLGGFLVFSIFATYALLMKTKKKWLLGLTLPFQIFAMTLSFSRSALYAWALATLCFFTLLFIRRTEKQRVIWLAKIISVSFALTATLLYNQYLHRGGMMNSSSLSARSDNIRIIQQNSALEILKEVPITGLGFSQFSERSQKFLSHTNDAYIQSTAPHNIFLFLGCETGIISVFALILFFFTLVLKTLRSELTTEICALFSLLIAFLFIGFCDFYPILFQQGKLMLFLTASLLSLQLIARCDKKEPSLKVIHGKSH